MVIDKLQKIQLLETLYRDARFHANDLQNDTNISRQTISKLRKRFWESGVIKRATILFNPQILNLQYFFMEIRTNPAEPDLLRLIQQIPGVVALDGVIGDYALVVKFEVQTKQAFAKVLANIDSTIARTHFQSYRIIETIDVFKMGGIIFPISPKPTIPNLPHLPSSPDSNNMLEIPILNYLDEKKWHILRMLERNFNWIKWPERYPGEFFSESEKNILERVNLSREMEHFEKDHIIARYTIAIDPNEAKIPDFHTKFIMRIKPRTIGQYNELAEQLKYHPNIIDLFRTGEDAGLLAVVRTEGLKGFRIFINNLYTQYPILDTHTTVVIEELIPTVFPPTLKASQLECIQQKE